MTPAQAKTLVACLMAAFPRQQVSRRTLDVYARLLGDLDADKAAAAVKRLAQTTRWFPTVSEIREEYARAQSNMPPPELAWAEVVRELGRVGPAGSPSFSCEAVGYAVRATGGWEYLCTSERNPWDRARFIDAYRAAHTAAVRAIQTGDKLELPSQTEAPKEFTAKVYKLADHLRAPEYANSGSRMGFSESGAQSVRAHGEAETGPGFRGPVV